jgi:hypothetical protein
MDFRVVSWNIAGGKPGHGADQQAFAWEYLTQTLVPDVALLQEAAVPTDHAGPMLAGIPKRRWGSAIIAPSSIEQVLSVKMGRAEIVLDRSAPGSLVAAYVPSFGVSAVSIYGQLEGGYAVTTVNRQLSDLTFLIDSPLGKRLLIGGDLNCSTQLSPPDRARHRALFQRVESLGLVDLLAVNAGHRPVLVGCPCDDAPCLHVQTHRHSRSAVPWQDDYLFVTPWLAARCESCVVDEGSFAFSDHGAVVAAFSLDDAQTHV